MIELDGNYGEGGGALVRVALALSALTGKEFHVNNIRAGREQGGLKAQHLTAITALKEICSAETSQVEIGSTEFTFRPGKIKRGTFSIDIGTAGSISLVLQGMLLPCLFAPSKVTLKLKGGTCGLWQAPVDYIQYVLVPHLQRFIEKIDVKIIKRGYYPKGGGEVTVEITPRISISDFANFDMFWQELQQKVKPIMLTEQGTLEQIRGIVDVSHDLQEKEVGERVRLAAEGSLRKYNVPITIRVEYAAALNTGGNITLWGIFSQKGRINFTNPVIVGSDGLLLKDKTSEQIGKEAALKLAAEIDASFPVDHHLADQIIQLMGLLPGSEIHTAEASSHALTNMYVVEKFLPVKFEVQGSIIKVKQV